MKFTKFQAARIALSASISALYGTYQTLRSDAMWDKCEGIKVTTEIDMKHWYDTFLKGKR